MNEHRVLALITEHDPPGSFRDLELTLGLSTARMDGVRLTTRRVDSLDDIYAALSKHRAEVGPVNTFILAFHGHANKIHFGIREGIHQRTLGRSLGNARAFLHPRARVILYACLTGEGDDNWAGDLAKVLQREVMAPRYFWLMQTAVPPADRTPELVLDSDGCMSVDEDRFALYYKRRMDSGRDRYLIAPKAMEWFCREDGFEVRSSRFRKLFETFK